MISKIQEILKKILCRHFWTVNREFTLNKSDCIGLRCIRCKSEMARYL